MPEVIVYVIYIQYNRYVQNDVPAPCVSQLPDFAPLRGDPSHFQVDKPA